MSRSPTVENLLPLFVRSIINPVNGVNYGVNYGTLGGRIVKVVASHAEGCKVARSNPGCGCAAPIYTMHEALRGYVRPMRVYGATSQLDLPSLMPLSVAGCGRLQL